jgi:hypothetical protein
MSGRSSRRRRVGPRWLSRRADAGGDGVTTPDVALGVADERVDQVLAVRPSSGGAAVADAGGLGSRARFAVRVLRADLANFFLLQYRTCDAFLITGKNSGTHWVKFMLSCAIARQYGVPPPARSSGREGDAIIGHPRWPSVHPGLPRIGSSHSIPSVAFSWRLAGLDHAPVVVLVRDIRDALASNYVKWRERYGVPFSQYLAGDPSGRRFVADVWWYVHFFNRWGDVARARPGKVLIVRYEDVQAAPAEWLRRVASHMGVALGEAALAAAMEYAERDAVLARLDPAYGEVIIPDAAARAEVAFSGADTALLDQILRRHLRHSLGYDYGLRGCPGAPALAQSAWQ